MRFGIFGHTLDSVSYRTTRLQGMTGLPRVPPDLARYCTLDLGAPDPASGCEQADSHVQQTREPIRCVRRSKSIACAAGSIRLKSRTQSFQRLYRDGEPQRNRPLTRRLLNNAATSGHPADFLSVLPRRLGTIP